MRICEVARRWNRNDVFPNNAGDGGNNSVLCLRVDSVDKHQDAKIAYINTNKQ